VKGAMDVKGLFTIPLFVDEEFTPEFMESLQRAFKIKLILDSEQTTKK